MSNIFSGYIGLIFECPKKKEEKDCPFREMRSKDMEGRLKWIQDLDNKELQTCISHHKLCTQGISRK